MKDRSDLNQVFGQLFIEKLLKGVKERLYRGKKQGNFDEIKKRHKENLQQAKKMKNDEEDV